MPDSSRYAPPEIAKGGWETIKRNPLPATDSYNFGCLVFEVFNGSFRGNDQAGQTSNVPPSMHQSYKRLMNPNPKLRLSVAHFLEQGKRSGGFFETPLIRLTQDIESLGLKSEEEREEFIKYFFVSFWNLNDLLSNPTILVNSMSYQMISPRISLK